MDGQLELLPPEPVDLTEFAAQIGAIEDARSHEPLPTDADERRRDMAYLRGEDLVADQGAPPIGFDPKKFGPGKAACKQIRATLDATTPRPTI